MCLGQGVNLHISIAECCAKGCFFGQMQMLGRGKVVGQARLVCWDKSQCAWAKGSRVWTTTTSEEWSGERAWWTEVSGEVGQSHQRRAWAKVSSVLGQRIAWTKVGGVLLGQNMSVSFVGRISDGFCFCNI